MEYTWYLKSEVYQPYAQGKIFTPEECAEIISIGTDKERATRDQGGIDTQQGGRLDPSKRKTEISWIRSDIENNRWLFDKLGAFVNEVNGRFFEYELEFIQNLQFTEYRAPDNFYGSHVDVEPMAEKTRKLSFTIQLTDPQQYDGGDLILHIGEDVAAQREQGNAMVFPSYTLHEVTPVTRGTRHSLVGWVAGPKWR